MNLHNKKVLLFTLSILGFACNVYAGRITVGGTFPKSIENGDNDNHEIYEVQTPGPKSPYVYVAIPERDFANQQDGISLWRLDASKGDSNAFTHFIGNRFAIQTQAFHVSLAFSPEIEGYTQNIYMAYVDQKDNSKLKVVKNTCSAQVDSQNSNDCKWESYHQNELDSVLGSNHREQAIALKVANDGDLILAYQERGTMNIGLLKYDIPTSRWIKVINPTNEFKAGPDKIYLELMDNGTPWVAYIGNGNAGAGDQPITLIRQNKNNPSQWDRLPAPGVRAYTNEGYSFTKCMGEKPCLAYPAQYHGNYDHRDGINIEIYNPDGSNDDWKHYNYHGDGNYMVRPAIVDAGPNRLPSLSYRFVTNEGGTDARWYVNQVSYDSNNGPHMSELTNIDSDQVEMVPHWADGLFQPLTFASNGSNGYFFYKTN